MRDGHHQLDTVDLIYLARAGVVVHGDDIRLRVATFELLHYALARDVVGQARKRLHADYVGRALLDKFEHLRGQEPAFADHRAEQRDFLGALGELFDMRGRAELSAAQRVYHGLAHVFEVGDAYVRKQLRFAFAVQEVVLDCRVVQRVHKEIE